MRVEGTACVCGRGQSDIVIHEQHPCGTRCPARDETSVPGMQERIVKHCAPTLAGLKCGSMFRVCRDPHGIHDCLDEIRGSIGPRGVRIDILDRDEGSCLLYVYRPKLLAARMDDPAVRDFMTSVGYSDFRVDALVSELSRRFGCFEGMPHEVGIFLDYPMEDVLGYIENAGRGCRCVGCWKVYGDVAEAEKRFSVYHKCRSVLSRRLSEGCDLSVLTVEC